MRKSDKISSTALTDIGGLGEAGLNIIPFPVDIVDERGVILFANKALKNIIGEKAIGKKCWDLYKDNKKQCIHCPLKKGITHGQTEQIETRDAFGGRILDVYHTGLVYEGKKAVLEIFIDITDRKKLEDGLRELSKRKSDFVTIVTHEFKNPLAIIKDFLSVILEGVAGEISAKQKNMLERARHNVDRLIRLVADLLDISIIESGNMAIRREEIDLGGLVHEVLENYEKGILKNKLNLKKNIPGNAGTVWADRDKVIQVLVNLFSNAIKYTPSGGDIIITLQGMENDIRFDIFNSGKSISKQNIEKLFNKFERITAEKQEGTGLGLFISRDIIELHKGKMWVESEDGAGNKFIFTLPRDLRKEGSCRGI